ncbi:FG-GAP repeat domain-containing protein [Sediminibacterium sp.]|uniref:FG-GAP repeat domain-containing protein n=1 Tax=Sediminibacterium sp. TaxID=1917865 RepID=UPI003F720AAB
MFKLIIFIISLLMGSSIFAQTLFNKSKPIVYTKVKFEQIKDTAIPNKTVQINLKGKKGFAIEKVVIIEQESSRESSYIHFYKANKIIQKILVPFWIRHLTPNAEVADFNNDGIPDIKFRIYTAGNGMAALLNYKVYLMSQQTNYRVMSFVDFSSEKEYDLNGDGLPEIIGCSSTNYNGHNYWVFNLYNWVNGTLVSVSKTYEYPLWTAVDFKTNKVIAKDIPASIRNATLRSFPNEYFIK